MPRWFRAVLALALLAAPGAARGPLGGGGEGQRAPPRAEAEEREYHIKAAFLLNFIRYTTWPEASFDGPTTPITVLVVGRDPFGDALEDTFRGEKVGGRKIEVARARELPREPKGHVVYCALAEKAERAELIARCAGRSILLVGETPAFAEDGACINFYLSDKKTRFEVNTEAVAGASLVISPAVLKLAKIVKTRKESQR